MSISKAWDYCVTKGSTLLSFVGNSSMKGLGFIGDIVVRKPIEGIVDRSVEKITGTFEKTSTAVCHTALYGIDNFRVTTTENIQYVTDKTVAVLAVSLYALFCLGILHVANCQTYEEDDFHTVTKVIKASLQIFAYINLFAVVYHFLKIINTPHLQRLKHTPKIASTEFGLPILSNFSPSLFENCEMLMTAASKGDFRKIIELQQKGIPLEMYDSKGKTALHYAAINHHRKVIDLLWYYGVNFKTPTNDSQAKLPIHFLSKWTTLHGHFSSLMGTSNRLQLPEQPLYPFYPPENLVFKGGGPKGIAYVGVGKYLEQENFLQRIRRVAGTSAGAINAVLVALNYSASAMEKIILEKNLLDFLDHPLLQEFLKAKEVWTDPPNPKDVTLQNLWDSLITVAKWNHFCKADNKSELLKTAFSEIYEQGGICSGDSFREWIEMLIYQKTAIHDCTFGELRRLVEEVKGFKHLYLFATQILQKKIVCINSEDMTWDQVIISDAVRASMAIPGVFKPHFLHIKEPLTNTREKAEGHGPFSDGGMTKNCPIDAFDSLHYFATNPTATDSKHTHWQTLGFNLIDPPKETGSINRQPTLSEVLQNAILTIADAEDIHHQSSDHAKRLVNIDNQGMELIAGFFATLEEKKDRIRAGFDTVQEFFEEQKKQALRFKNCDPRQILDKEVLQALELLSNINDHQHTVVTEEKYTDTSTHVFTTENKLQTTVEETVTIHQTTTIKAEENISLTKEISYESNHYLQIFEEQEIRRRKTLKNISRRRGIKIDLTSNPPT